VTTKYEVSDITTEFETKFPLITLYKSNLPGPLWKPANGTLQVDNTSKMLSITQCQKWLQQPNITVYT